MCTNLYPINDLLIESFVSMYIGQTEESMNVEIGYIHCPLEGRFTEIRTRESNLGEHCIPAPTPPVLPIAVIIMQL